MLRAKAVRRSREGLIGTLDRRLEFAFTLRSQYVHFSQLSTYQLKSSQFERASRRESPPSATAWSLVPANLLVSRFASTYKHYLRICST